MRTGRIGRAAALLFVASCHPAVAAEGDVVATGAGPVVVLEAGLGEGTGGWDAVIARLAPCFTLVRTDRAALRRRLAPDASAVLAEDVAARLKAALGEHAQPAPYILVGHSLGGLYAQAFARRYPEAVAGLVLADAASPLEPPGVFVSTMPPPAGTEAAAEEAGVAPSVAAMNAGPPLPPVPLRVLAATDHGDTPERERLWQQVQARTAALSPRGRLDVVASGHFVQRDAPEAVVEAVLAVAAEAGIAAEACTPARR